MVIAFLAATYHYHIHFSRLVLIKLLIPFYGSIVAVLYRALDEHRWLDWALAGGVAGLAFYLCGGTVNGRCHARRHCL
ncbi:MAG: hypothetical protein H6658_07735 [Ardenticatenaceae bacterium]|nr:hypothetical protein [Ardenticatenaceae bacterium]